MMPAHQWLDLNARLAFEDPSLRSRVAPLPPAHLIQDVAGTSSEIAFAQHGTHFFAALAKASPIPLDQYGSILDFGCGCARLGRMFLGHPGTVTGCDIDARHIDWINANLPYMRAVKTEPNQRLPFGDASFDAIISISVFTHITEVSQRLYLEELARVARPGATLFLSTHGERALARVLEDDRMFRNISVSRDSLTGAEDDMKHGRHSFIRQQHGHPTERTYDYGITFIPASYVRSTWSDYFDIQNIVSGAIHDWQDIVVCRKRL